MRAFALWTLVLGLAAACGSESPRPTVGDGSDAEARPPSGETPQPGDGGGGEPRVDPTGDEPLTVTTESLDVGGAAREYVLVRPKPRAGETYPLVLVLHGDGGTGPTMHGYHAFEDASGADAVVAYPTGLGRSWDIYTPSASNDDVRFVEALVPALAERLPIDTSRVFGVGYSSGAFFINKVACRKTGFFRGIVSHAGGAPDESKDPSASTWPDSGYTKCGGQTGGVAAMVIHGASDGAVPVDGGEFNAMYWAKVNGCGDTQSPEAPPPCVRYDGCPADAPVLWCLIPGLSHVVWGEGARGGWAFMQSL